MRARHLLALALLTLLAPLLPAETFRMPEQGISLTVPDGWTHNEKDTFGYVLVPPADQPSHNKNEKIRVHLTDRNARTLAEQLELGIESVTQKAPKWGSSTDRKRFLGSSEVTTRSGLIGLKGAFGYKKEDGSIDYTINMYYFRNSAGKILCVCAYVFGPEPVAQQYENIILGGLRLLKK